MGTRSARPARRASRCGLRLRNRHRKRMPKNHALHVARCTTHEKGEGFSAVGGIKDEAMLQRKPAGGLALRCWVAVARPQPVHYDQRDSACRKREADVVTREAPPCGV